MQKGELILFDGWIKMGSTESKVPGEFKALRIQINANSILVQLFLGRWKGKGVQEESSVELLRGYAMKERGNKTLEKLLFRT